ncbi:hypothetical protein AUEXF2481DRAFT_449618 [Aureobasidium subglaciale EXF-2481]|uniref:Folliculin-interacting protein N-terminal domain-containing protein n=1 Tax=Aureobasidium subglaciale (strain EXF-2481) TaxID=1043005 RepID=A0A074Y2A8_AURSE|nr:uncharacterized protein AUEXF2481DRAFT_449618 [Aureobasidium subglaciale EXF-2481]KEQ91938.1 hypothetical protein AUEXF2481DRAFT_449618 [Aureobasidium subglaciale EXF-2481]
MAVTDMMHRFSRSRGESQEPERNEAPVPSTRSLSLLFPPRESYDRANNTKISSNTPNEPLYDQDTTITFPLSPDEEPRIIIAQDDTGVSIDRLLFDSQWTRKTSRVKTDDSNGESKNFSSRPSSSVGPQSPTSSGFLRSQQSRGHRSTISVVPERNGSPPTRPSMPRLDSTFVPSTQFRRTPTTASLADSRKDINSPVENTAEEMDSWLDCMFGKAPMRYKGPVTKLHHVQRQPPDEPQDLRPKSSPRSGFGSYQAKDSSPLRPSSTVSIKRRKDALLLCTTFAVNMHDEDLPEQLQQAASSHGSHQSCPRKKRFSTPMFGVAILLPLKNGNASSDKKRSQGHLSDQTDPVQAILDDWHIFARALDALRTTTLVHIQQRLKIKAEALARSKTAVSRTVPRLVKLEPSAFEHTSQILEMSSSVIDRIVRSYQVLQAGPQRDWSIWRDELRDYTRVSQDADSKRGFFNLHKINFMQAALTAALGVDLGWLNIFAPPQHQARLREERQKSRTTFDQAQNRTVIVSMDQNKARNLIFIFAKLFPCPASEAQFESLRRSSSSSLNSAKKCVSALTQGLKSVEYASDESQTKPHTVEYTSKYNVKDAPRTPTIFEPMLHASPGSSPTKTLAINNLASSTRKSSIVNTSGKIDISGKATMAVPISAPTSGRNTPSGSPETRPGSSLNAQGDLMRHLQRASSSTTSNGSTDYTSLWNSLRSSTRSLKPRRESSLTERSDSFTSSGQREQPPGILKTSKSFAARQSSNKLVRMVEEVHGIEEADEKNGQPNLRRKKGPPRISPITMAHKTSALQFDPPTSDYAGIAYTYNQDEGIVDVDFPGCTPIASVVRNPSPKVPRFKVPSNRGQFPLQKFSTVEASPVTETHNCQGLARYDRIAGYLGKFHPDFALQATRPYAELVDEVKCAMRAEPSPMVEPSENLRVFSQETWIDVCSTVFMDAEALTVRKLILRRRVRYKLIVPDDSPNFPRQHAAVNGRKQSTCSSNGSGSDQDSQIKVIKSDDMDSIKRTYKRNDNGQKTGFRDQRILKTDLPNAGSAEGVLNNHVAGRHSIDALGNVLSEKGDNVETHSSSAQSSHTNGSRVDSPMMIKDQSALLDHRPSATVVVGEDLSEFIEHRKTNSFPAKEAAAVVTATKRVPIHNKEGKISGWKEVCTNKPDEPGLNDLPTGFVEKRRDKAAAIVECQTLAEKFDEETISKPDSAIVGLLQQMLATSETRSRADSRANSVHSRAPSRSNSISGSGLTELQYESKKIIEDALEGLVSAVASDKYTSNNASSGGLFSFARSAVSTPEPSFLRQSISKWMYGDA